MLKITIFTRFCSDLKVTYRLTQLVIFRRKVIQVAKEVEVRRAVAVVEIRVRMSALRLQIVEVLMAVARGNVLRYVVVVGMHGLLVGRRLRLLLLLMLVVLLE